MSKMVLYALGIIFVVIGILGFIMNPILGIFEVDMMHNMVHIVSGLLFLGVAAFAPTNARVVAIVFGVVYGLVAVLGLATQGDTIFGLMQSNLADDILHVVIAALLLYVGLTDKPSAPMPMMNSGMGGGM